MPIKFHCKYCQQFLGISQSRAGAVVDCPQCGRSVRVPELDGRTRKLPQKPQSKSDDALVSALSELSALNEATADSGGGLSLANTLQPAEQIAETFDVPVVPQPTQVEAIRPIESQDAIQYELSKPEYSDTPVALSDSLMELASIDGESAPNQVSNAMLEDMRLASRGRGWLSGSTILVSLLTLLVGVAGGWLVGSGKITLQMLGLDTANSVDSSLKDSAQQDQVAKLPQPLPAGAADVVVQGTVQFQSGSGHLLPDAGALVLLLPNNRIGSLLLDGRSLQQQAFHPNFLATAASLNVFGATVAKTDEEGQFAISGAAGDEATIVIVSKHSQRPSDLPLAPATERLLSLYFQSPNHLCGRLNVQTSVVDHSAPLDFQFAAQQ